MAPRATGPTPPALEWRPTDDFSLIAFYRSDTEIYFLADRLQDSQRFFVFDQRAAVGLERTLGRRFALEATASYIFDRQLFQGTNFLSGRTDVVAFEPGLSGVPPLSARFGYA